MTTGITSILKNILKFITFIGAVVAAVFLLRAFVIEPFVVPTGSMESTIEVGDCILAQKITLETGSDLKPGDIVVFKNPRPRNGVDILVKRVIATSGQTVDLKDGKVYVDGRHLDESYAMGESKPLDAHLSLAPDSYPYTIPDGCIWRTSREGANDSYCPWCTPYRRKALNDIDTVCGDMSLIDGVELSLETIDGHGAHLKMSHDNDIDRAWIPINYCPICGRNLRKDV